jgi:hypothetical protein
LDRFFSDKYWHNSNAACRAIFQEKVFASTVPPGIIDDRALSRPKLKSKSDVLHFDNAQSPLASGKSGNFGSNDSPILPTVRTELLMILVSRCLKQCLEEWFFDDGIALKGAASDIMMSIEPDPFVRVCAEWKQRSRYCTDQRDGYL